MINRKDLLGAVFSATQDGPLLPNKSCVALFFRFTARFST